MIEKNGTVQEALTILLARQYQFIDYPGIPQELVDQARLILGAAARDFINEWKRENTG